MPPVVVGTWSPNKKCGSFVVIGKLPKEKKKFDEKRETWDVARKSCGTPSTISRSELIMRQVSSEWLEQEYPEI